MNRRNITLVGFMGTGKSTVGRILAKRLGMRFVDMDGVIEGRAGMKISRIFAEQGEARFRELERALVKELSAEAGLVIAAGGGVVLNPDNMRDFAGAGAVVCLTAEPGAILRRVAGAKHRPLLEEGDKEARILKLLEARRSLYEAVPDRVDTTALGPDGVAAKILEIQALRSCKP